MTRIRSQILFVYENPILLVLGECLRDKTYMKYVAKRNSQPVQQRGFVVERVFDNEF